jgi:putative ATPase
MLASGEDPLFLARRMVRMAVEDIGLADPRALTVTMEAMRAYQLLGSPEGELALAQAAAYPALAPKSNAVYMATKAVAAEIERTGTLPVPLPLRNAPTRLMKDLDYGKGYSYDHSAAEAFIPKQGLPDELHGRRFYEPTAQGEEETLRAKLAAWDAQRDKIKPGGEG